MSIMFIQLRKKPVPGFVVNQATGEIGRIISEGLGFEVEYPATYTTSDGTVSAYMVRGDYWPHARPATTADARLYDASLWESALSANVQH